MADPENFGGGDFKHKTSKIRMSSPKLRVIFRPKSEIQTIFSPKIRWSPKKKKKRFSPKLRVIFQPKSEIQTIFSPKIRWSPKKKKRRKKKRFSPKLRVIFRPDSLRLGWWGGDASRNGAELFEIEADFSAKIVTFRLVGGDASPPSPPLNPPLIVCSCYDVGRHDQQNVNKKNTAYKIELAVTSRKNAAITFILLMPGEHQTTRPTPTFAICNLYICKKKANDANVVSIN